MIDVLSQILCWIKQLGALFLSALVAVVNLLLLGLAAFVQSVLDLLPDMPSAPDFSGLPSGVTDAFGSAGYYLPITGILAWFTAFLLLWFAWLVLSVALRWFKAVPGGE